MISTYQGIERFIFRRKAVPDDEFMSVTVLSKYFIITESGVNIVSSLR